MGLRVVVVGFIKLMLTVSESRKSQVGLSLFNVNRSLNVYTIYLGTALGSVE